jgi:heme A synthase
MMPRSISNFSRFAWSALVYNIFVILFGAFVRATGSGAGCGEHWPLCNGVVLPRPERIETVIEFTHRITSGITLILAFIFVIWAWRTYSRGSVIRKTAGLVLFFTITEALVGAGLVLFGLVQDNDSVARAISMMVHLVNTFLLLASIALTAYWSTIGPPERISLHGVSAVLAMIGCASILVLGASGAITALGDTLFPSTSLVEGLKSDFADTSHYLIQLRVYHPAIAVTVGVLLFCITYIIRRKIHNAQIDNLTNILFVLYIVQILIGIMNVALLAPVWLQIVHLLQSNMIWISFVLLTGEVLGDLSPGTVHQEVYKTVEQFTGQNVVDRK